MTRDILDYQGNVIGQIEFPDDTPDAVVEAKLAAYAVAPTPTIQPITARQIRLQLLYMGISLGDIDTALNSLPEPQKSLALVEWEFASTFDRSHALVDFVGATLGWTSEQLDQLWLAAVQL